jgi:hypothetical protein
MASLKEIYRALDPATPATDPRHYVSRPGDPMGILREELTIRDTPLRVIVGGQRGVGKTTELNRLYHSLERSKLNCNLFSADRKMGVTFWPDLLVATISFKLAKEFLSPHSAGRIRATELMNKINATPESEIKNEAITITSRSIANEVIKEMNLGNDRPALVVFDGLEKYAIQGTATLLGALLDLPCSLVVVVPLPLLLSPDYASTIAECDRVVSLPAIALRQPNGSRDEDGVALLRTVVERRAGTDAFESSALDAIIEASGGIHRDLLTLAQQSCMRAAMSHRTKVTDADVRASIEERRQELSFHLTPSDLAYLVEVKGSKRLTGDPRAVPLISRNLIVSYHGDWAWFDVHPLIQPLLATYEKMASSS